MLKTPKYCSKILNIMKNKAQILIIINQRILYKNSNQEKKYKNLD